jgi:hypothetical protein
MSNLIYKYPNVKSWIESNRNPIYLNPHANLIEYFRNNQIAKYWLSCHPSNAAIEMLIKNRDLIDIYGLIKNTNPKVGYLLDRSMHLFKGLKWRDTWRKLSCSRNPGVLEFLEKHPKKIDWTSLSSNDHPLAIRILKQHPEKIVWWILSGNPSAMDLLTSNLDKIDWGNFCHNPHPQVIKIIEQNLDEVDIGMLSSNPDAVHIISKNLDKVWGFQLSKNTNPAALKLLIKNPTLIDLRSLLKNPSAIPYLEKSIEIILEDHSMKEFYLEDLAHNPKGLPLIEKLLEDGIISKKEFKKSIEEFIIRDNSVYDLDYQAMSKARSTLIFQDLIAKALHPDRVSKWLDYFCDNGGEVSDFDWL